MFEDVYIDVYRPSAEMSWKSCFLTLLFWRDGLVQSSTQSICLRSMIVGSFRFRTLFSTYMYGLPWVQQNWMASPFCLMLCWWHSLGDLEPDSSLLFKELRTVSSSAKFQKAAMFSGSDGGNGYVWIWMAQLDPWENLRPSWLWRWTPS